MIFIICRPGKDRITTLATHHVTDTEKTTCRLDVQAGLSLPISEGDSASDGTCFPGTATAAWQNLRDAESFRNMLQARADLSKVFEKQRGIIHMDSVRRGLLRLQVSEPVPN